MLDVANTAATKWCKHAEHVEDCNLSAAFRRKHSRWTGPRKLVRKSCRSKALTRYTQVKRPHINRLGTGPGGVTVKHNILPSRSITTALIVEAFAKGGVSPEEGVAWNKRLPRY